MLMDADELELKRRDYQLEKWKFFLSILTPVILVILTFIVNNALQERGEVLKRQEQVLAEKQRIYAEIAENLNVIYVYLEDVGDFRQYTPVVVVQKKRETDRLFHMYRPYWSAATEEKYNAYINAAFKTYNGAGFPARINASKDQKVAAYKHDGLTWSPSWDGYFTEHEDATIPEKYGSLTSSMLADIVSTKVRSLGP